MDSHYRIKEIAEKHNIHTDTIRYRIRQLGIIPTAKWFYDEYQIELILDFERTPRINFIIIESKL